MEEARRVYEEIGMLEEQYGYEFSGECITERSISASSSI